MIVPWTVDMSRFTSQLADMCCSHFGPLYLPTNDLVKDYSWKLCWRSDQPIKIRNNFLGYSLTKNYAYSWQVYFITFSQKIIKLYKTCKKGMPKMICAICNNQWKKCLLASQRSNTSSDCWLLKYNVAKHIRTSYSQRHISEWHFLECPAGKPFRNGFLGQETEKKKDKKWVKQGDI